MCSSGMQVKREFWERENDQRVKCFWEIKGNEDWELFIDTWQDVNHECFHRENYFMEW